MTLYGLHTELQSQHFSMELHGRNTAPSCPGGTVGRVLQAPKKAGKRTETMGGSPSHSQCQLGSPPALLLTQEQSSISSFSRADQTLCPAPCPVSLPIQQHRAHYTVLQHHPGVEDARCGTILTHLPSGSHPWHVPCPVAGKCKQFSCISA